MSTEAVPRLNAALEGRYRVERELGEGGMATVYLAEDLRHERKVALKVLRPELAAAVGAGRFLAEIRTTANLQHPHILPLFDSGEAEGLLFYAMPWVRGESLRERLDRETQLPVDEAVDIARNVAEALDYAHRQGVIHRDIKPANILLLDGKPVVSDFGIALAVVAGGPERLTGTGLSLGTPHYMSPEQATGDRGVGPATDIYALGCVLYEMLVGEPPYTGSTPQAILGKIVSGQLAPVTKQRPSVPANVDATIAKALELVPADRFTEAGGFSTALSRSDFRHGHGKGADGTGYASRRRRSTVGAVVLAGVLGAVAGGVLLGPELAAPVVRTQVPLPRDVGLQTTAGVAFALSPDGSRVVLAGTTDGVSRLWLRPLSELAAVPIPGTEGARTPAFAPDGSRVAFVSAGRLMVVSLDGAPPLALVEEGLAGGASGLAWSEDGWLYFRRAEQGGLLRVSVAGGAEEIVSNSSGQDLHPEPVPGGRGLLFTRDLPGGESQIVLLNLLSGEERALFEGSTARYASPGHIAFTSADGTLLAVPFDTRALEVTGRAVPIFAGIETAPVAGSQFAISRDGGTFVYLEGGGASGLSLGEVDLEGNRSLLPLPRRNYVGRGPSWSPDGRSIVFSEDLQIYTYDTGLAATPRRLTFEGENARPVFSPDGRRVVFTSVRGEGADADLFVKDLGDDSPARPLFVAGGAQYPTQWPADTLILFTHVADAGRSELRMLQLPDGRPPRAVPYLESTADLDHFTVSPDGRLASYASSESGSEAIYVRSFPVPGEPSIVFAGGGIPSWGPDGTTLYYGTRLGRYFVRARLRRDLVPTILSVDTLFGDPGIALVPTAGGSLHPDGDRFVLVLFPTPSDSGDEAAPARLILVQSFSEVLSGMDPGS